MYCTLDEIKTHMPSERIVELSDDKNPGLDGTIGRKIVEGAIKESAVLINSMIGGRYSLPLPNTPPILKNICVDLSIYNLYERRTALDDNPGLRKRYDNAMKLLNKIADGKILLGVPMSAESPGFFAGSLVDGGPAQFTINAMRGL